MSGFLGDDDAAPDVRTAADLLRRVAWASWATGLAAAAATGPLAPGGLPLPGEAGFGARAGLLAAFCLVAAAPAWGLVRRPRDRAWTMRALWAAPGVCLFAAARTESLAVAGLGLVAFALLLAGLGFAQADDARTRAAASLRRGVLPPEPPRSAWRRTRPALGLGLPALAVAALLSPVTTCTPARSAAVVAGGRGSTAPGGRDAAGESSGTGVVVDPAASGSDFSALARTVLLEVTPSRDGAPTGDLGAIYLRGLPLTDIDGDGRWQEDVALPPRVRDRDDGAADGWCTFAEAPADRERLDLAVRQIRLDHGASGLTLVHAPSGTTAVELPRVRYAADGAILCEGAPAGNLLYRVVCTSPDHLSLPGETTPAADGVDRTLALPSGRASVDLLLSKAREVTADVASDVARVRAVVRHLRSAYAYRGLGAMEDDAAALDAFVAQGAGTCVQFAEAAAFMLRGVGIPARVATGFLVREWDPDRGLYLARGRDYHAWVEVAFEGCGWVAFDATPAVPEGADRLGDDGGDRLAAGRIGAFVRGIADAAGGAGGIAMLAVSVILLAALLALVARRGRALEFDEDDAPAAPPSGVPSWDLLLAELARRGHRRRPAQTALEFAAAVARTGGTTFAPFVDLTRRQQAARFGGRPLTRDDERAIDAFRRSL